tara:strand:- start:402 stop:605 length:204 start_codon:yes stop_codon:yes gene_type:complete
VKIFVNDEAREVTEDAELSAVLRDLGLEPGGGWAVAVNEEVAPIDSWDSRRLGAGDRILLVRATPGG